MTQVRIKLVQGATYGCPAFPGENKTLKRGESIVVDRALADVLLQDSFTDKAGAERHYFDEIEADESADGDGAGEGAGEGEGGDTQRRPAPAKTVQRKRN